MPRSLLGPATVKASFNMPGTRLWNAKRRIQASRGLGPAHIEEFEKDPFSQAWRKAVSEDVVDFVDNYEGRDKLGHPIREMLPEQKMQLLKSPARYFSRPHHVPNELRKQIKFPDFTVMLLRTPHLGPQYASFDVPLWFGKLDLKSYLQNLYSVDVHHIRSFVIHQKVQRRDPARKYQQGPTYQPTYKKKMTVQLVKPFQWPKEITQKELNDRDYEAENFWKSTIAYAENARKMQEPFPTKPNQLHRISIAEQAKALLEGREKWEPTWRQIEPHARTMEGRRRQLPPPTASGPSDGPSLLR